MKKNFNIVLFLLVGLLFSFLSSVRLSASVEPDKTLYQSSPFMATYRMIPRVLLVLSKHINMFQQAYPGVVDMDGDGRVDTGFNPAIEYVGIFDSRSCYAYDGIVNYGRYQVRYVTGDPKGIFRRVGPTVEDETAAEIWAGRPKGLPDYVVSPRSVAGICRQPGEKVSKTFSGNWLNYITTSRMDAVRRILYGGSRSVDTPNETILSGSYVPQDSTVWGYEVRSDDDWAGVTPLNAYHDIGKYTPYPKPKSRKAHFFARGSDLSRYERFPALRALLDVDKASMASNYHTTNPATHLRYWDWTMTGRPMPNDYGLVSELERSRVNVYHVRVRSCVQDNIADGEGCARYPGLTESEEDDVYKPGGLLQRYGGSGNSMYFGLMTGGYNTNIRVNGGKLRNHIGPVFGREPTGPGAAAAYVPSVDERTGVFLDGGLIANLEKLRVAGRIMAGDPRWDSAKSPPEEDGVNYKNKFSWGNPLGEMLYEAVRYISGALNPTYVYSSEADSDADVAWSSILRLTDFGSGDNAWNTRKPEFNLGNCLKPVILVISDINTDYDGDNIGTGLKRTPLRETAPGGGLSQSDLPAEFDWKKYLNTMTRLEDLDKSGRVKYYFSTGAQDNCAPKPLEDGLAGVKGLCPMSPGSMGTYSAAAVAYFSHIHDFNNFADEGKQPLGVDVYAVSMGATFPELSLSVLDSAGQIVKKVAIIPVNISGSYKSFFGFLNYFVVDWETDRRGSTFRAKIMVNFSDLPEGNDWEGDGLVTFNVELLTDSSTPQSMRDSTPVDSDSGDPDVMAKQYYKFMNPPGAKRVDEFIQIEPDMVKAVRIRSEWAVRGTTAGMAMGYTISGTERDGTYLELTMNTPDSHPNLTPTGCPWVGANNSNCRKRVKDLKNLTRIFAIANSNSELAAIPDPLWLTAKYGGFNDWNKNSVPDQGEWEGADGLPSNYFQAKNIATLPAKLEAAFQGIAKSVSTASTTSASINSVMNSGISVQTAFYPTYFSPDDPNKAINWVGTVYALFVDKNGNLRENDSVDENYLSSDNSVLTFNSVFNPPEPPPACYSAGSSISKCAVDSMGNIVQPPLAPPKNVHRLKAIWDVGKRLSIKPPEDRNIFYISPKTEKAVPFDFEGETFIELKNNLLHDNYDHILYANTANPPDKDEATRQLIKYIQGHEIEGFRSRTIEDPWDESSNKTITWRLGDTINSKPIIVGQPPFNYDFLYHDLGYSAFKTAKATRRQVVYFGSNDGLLHAVNMGKFGSLPDGKVGYKGDGKELGEELWALIPRTALPHLQWLADPTYVHSYYVDMKPLLADVNFGSQEYPDWRTILVCGLRLGGRPIESPDSTDSEPKNVFSEIFVLDVTDPEVSEPQVIWRYSDLGLGLSVGMPAVVTSGGEWFVILPSGPVTDKVGADGKLVFSTNTSPYDGNSSQKAKLFVLEAVTGKLRTTIESDVENSFFNDPFVPMPLKV
jgi:type IV pilus assembly protein PilY1